jgi:hypothetical protein
MSTLMHTYRLVSAYLFRMQDRSPIAEDAWNKAMPGEMVEPETFGQTSIRRLKAARNKAIGLISDGNHFRPERSRAIVAINEAVRCAVDVDLHDVSSGMLTLN